MSQKPPKTYAGAFEDPFVEFVSELHSSLTLAEFTEQSSYFEYAKNIVLKHLSKAPNKKNWLSIRLSDIENHFLRTQSNEDIPEHLALQHKYQLMGYNLVTRLPAITLAEILNSYSINLDGVYFTKYGDEFKDLPIYRQNDARIMALVEGASVALEELILKEEINKIVKNRSDESNMDFSDPEIVKYQHKFVLLHELGIITHLKNGFGFDNLKQADQASLLLEILGIDTTHGDVIRKSLSTYQIKEHANNPLTERAIRHVRQRLTSLGLSISKK